MPGRRERYVDTCIEQLDQFAPGVTDAVVEREVLAPPDLERIFGLQRRLDLPGRAGPRPDGVHAPVARLAQYATPVDGLYLCGAGTHPGGGVIGCSGHNAAKRVLRDRRRAS